MANQDFDPKSMPAFENNLPEQESSKTSIKCDLARLLVRATAVKRQLGKITGSGGLSELGAKTTLLEIQDLCKDMWESASIIHAEILEQDNADEDLDIRACKLEDFIFEVKEECRKVSLELSNKLVETGSAELNAQSACSGVADRSPVLPRNTKRFSQMPEVKLESSKPSLIADEAAVRCHDNYYPGRMIGGNVLTNDCSAPMPQLQSNDFPSHFGNVGAVEPPQGQFPSFYYGAPVGHYAGQLPPGPKLVLENFNGDVMKFWEFRRRFRRHIEEVYFAYEDRMAFLESMCVGKAHDAIAGLSCLVNCKEAYTKAWDRLEKRFGDTNKLMHRLKEELLDGPVIKESDARSLLCLSDKMYRCEVSLESWNKGWMLNSQQLMYKLFERLPYRLRSQFVTISSNKECATFQDLRQLVEKAAMEAESEYGQLLHRVNELQAGSSKSRGRKESSRQYCFALQAIGNDGFRQQGIRLSCICCKGAHQVWKCDVFKGKSVENRRSFVKGNFLCYNCLLPGHRVSNCCLRITCRKCNQKHNTLLHPVFEPDSHETGVSKSRPAGSDDREEVGDSIQPICAATSSGRSVEPYRHTIFKVVPVKVWAENTDCVQTYAFIDEGSSVYMCSASLVERLGVPMTATNVELVSSNAISVMDKKVDCLGIQGFEEASAFLVKDAFVVDEVVMAFFVVDEVVDVSASIPTSKLAHMFPHLSELNFPELDYKRVELLLGSDLHQGYLLKEVLKGEPGQPCGLHTSLGWTIYGKDSGDKEIMGSPRLMVNFIDHRDDEESVDKMLRIMAHDFDDCDNAGGLLSRSMDDKRALGIMERTVKKVGDHYSVGLLWKDDNPSLPNSRSLAVKRLMSLKCRLGKNPSLLERYKEKMIEYIQNYAESVPIEQPPQVGRVYYVPHHCTSGASKFRVVFAAALVVMANH